MAAWASSSCALQDGVLTRATRPDGKILPREIGSLRSGQRKRAKRVRISVICSSVKVSPKGGGGGFTQKLTISVYEHKVQKLPIQRPGFGRETFVVRVYPVKQAFGTKRGT